MARLRIVGRAIFSIMPVNVVTGPPFAGKSQTVAKTMSASDVLIDTTPLWRVLYPGHPPVRPEEQAMYTRRVMGMATRAAAEDPNLTAWLVLAESRQQPLERWMQVAQAEQVYIIADNPETLRKRAAHHARSLGLSDDECVSLVDRWQQQAGWMEDSPMIKDFDAEFRASDDEPKREIRTFVADGIEMRADDPENPRMVSGIAVKFGDVAKVADYTEVVAGRDAVILPGRAANVTIQHDRAAPIGLAVWKLDDDALRVSTTVNEGARGDQTLADIRGNLIRGWSLEFSTREQSWTGDEHGDGRRRTIESMQVHRVSLVDDGAYAKSVVARCKGCEDSEALRDLLTAALARSESDACSCGKAKRADEAPAPVEAAVLDHARYMRALL